MLYDAYFFNWVLVYNCPINYTDWLINSKFCNICIWLLKVHNAFYVMHLFEFTLLTHIIKYLISKNFKKFEEERNLFVVIEVTGVQRSAS